jgi:hypothetical protein
MSLTSRVFHRALGLALRCLSGACASAAAGYCVPGEARATTWRSGRSAHGGRVARWILGGALAWAVAWWLLAPASAPTVRAVLRPLIAILSPQPGQSESPDALGGDLSPRMDRRGLSAAASSAVPTRRRMHVVEVVPTDATFREPVRAFGGDTAFWRVAVRDALEQPVAAARVEVEVVGPDTAIRARPLATTGIDGLARFTFSLRGADVPGVYIVRVVEVSHPDCRDAAYDGAANAARSTSFSVSTALVVPDRTRGGTDGRATPPAHRHRP